MLGHLVVGQFPKIPVYIQAQRLERARLRAVLPFEIIDRYIKTSIDFWLLGGRRFVQAVKVDNGRYVSPAQYLMGSLSLLAAVFVLMFSFYKELPGNLVAHYPLLRMSFAPKTEAGEMIVELLLITFVMPLGNKLVSWLWPIRGRGSLREMIDFQFYSVAGLFLPYAFQVVSTYFLVSYIIDTKSDSANQALLIVLAIEYFLCLIVAFAYVLPGLAEINGVSYWRMFSGCVLWGVMTGGILGTVIFFVFL